jgi:hypothetical protein
MHWAYNAVLRPGQKERKLKVAASVYAGFFAMCSSRISCTVRVAMTLFFWNTGFLVRKYAGNTKDFPHPAAPPCSHPMGEGIFFAVFVFCCG